MIFDASGLEELRSRLLDRIVERDGPIEGSPCWIWTRTCSKGYGYIRWKRRMRQAHRMSWIAFIGLIPDGLWVLHHCDVPACLNPDHLYLGTVQDNTDDMWRRGRANPFIGEANGMASITEAQAAEIKFLVSEEQLLLREIANSYGVTRKMVGDIKHGRSWAWVEPREPPPPPPIPGFVRRI